MNRKIFIRGASAISPQDTFYSNAISVDIKNSSGNRFKCLEPNYAGYLNPVMARRMGRVVKLGLASAIECLNRSNVQMPDAIITGTALGCLGDTEKFLTAVIKDDEQFLTPTWFIQSLQNTVSAQIALHLKCMNHNFTFVHKGFSFESALLDAKMLLNEGDAHNVLVGGLDEMTDHNFHIYGRLNKWKSKSIDASALLNNYELPGTIAGEGSSFFVLSNEEGTVEFADVGMICSENSEDINNYIDSFIQKNELICDENTLILYGLSGDRINDEIYHELMSGKFKNCSSGFFKHLCGEYQTSSAFAMWLGSTILENEIAPSILQVPGKKFTTKPKSVLVVNHYENDFSVLLLRNREV